MPMIIIFKDIFEPGTPFGTLYFLIREDICPSESIQFLKQRVHNLIKFDKPSKEDVVQLIEDTLEECGLTLIPFSLYIFNY